MKHIVFVLAIVISNIAVSQIYSISVSSVKMHIKSSNVSYTDAVNFPDKIIDEVSTDTKHVLNLYDSTCSFYYHGVFLNTVKIVRFENYDNTLHFTMADYDSNKLTVYSNFIIDLTNNYVFYYWFNEQQQQTKVEIKTKHSIEIIN
jgi:hypothetical protein